MGKRISLYLPKNEAFLKKLRKLPDLSEEKSVSQLIFKLSIKDLYSRGLLSKEEKGHYVNSILKGVGHKTSKALELNSKTSVFSLYVIEEYQPILTLIDKVEKSRSSYFWKLIEDFLDAALKKRS